MSEDQEMTIIDNSTPADIDSIIVNTTPIVTEPIIVNTIPIVTEPIIETASNLGQEETLIIHKDKKFKPSSEMHEQLYTKQELFIEEANTLPLFIDSKLDEQEFEVYSLDGIKYKALTREGYLICPKKDIQLKKCKIYYY